MADFLQVTSELSFEGQVGHMFLVKETAHAKC